MVHSIRGHYLPADFERFELACRMMVERSLRDASMETNEASRVVLEANAETYQAMVERLKVLRHPAIRLIAHQRK